MREKVKPAMIDNPKNFWWNDVVKKEVERRRLHRRSIER